MLRHAMLLHLEYQDLMDAERDAVTNLPYFHFLGSQLREVSTHQICLYRPKST